MKGHRCQVPINYTRSRVEGHQKGEPGQQKERSVVSEQGGVVPGPGF